MNDIPLPPCSSTIPPEELPAAYDDLLDLARRLRDALIAAQP